MNYLTSFTRWVPKTGDINTVIVLLVDESQKKSSLVLGYILVSSAWIQSFGSLSFRHLADVIVGVLDVHVL